MNRGVNQYRGKPFGAFRSKVVFLFLKCGASGPGNVTMVLEAPLCVPCATP